MSNTVLSKQPAKKLPAYLKKLFWDVNFDKLDPEKYSQYVIGKILEYGDIKAVKWMFDNFKKKEIVKTLTEAKGCSARSAGFWSLILDIPSNKIPCLKKSYQKMQKSHWPY